MSSFVLYLFCFFSFIFVSFLFSLFAFFWLFLSSTVITFSCARVAFSVHDFGCLGAPLLGYISAFDTLRGLKYRILKLLCLPRRE